MEIISDTPDLTKLTKEERDTIEKINSRHILVFSTGAPSAPIISLNPKPSIKFVNDDAKFIPSVNTGFFVASVYRPPDNSSDLFMLLKRRLA